MDFFGAGVIEHRLPHGGELGGELLRRGVQFLQGGEKLLGLGLFGNPRRRLLLPVRDVMADDGIDHVLFSDLVAHDLVGHLVEVTRPLAWRGVFKTAQEGLGLLVVARGEAR